MRFGLALIFSLAGISACSFLLDTESLQKGGAGAGSGGGTGTGGAAGGTVADASIEGGTGCTSDFDCQGPTLDGCHVNKCDNHKCLPPTIFKGPAVEPEGQVDTVLTADDIGYPTLIADGTEFFLGAWVRSGTMSNIEIRKYPESVNVAGSKADLNTMFPGKFEQYGSSPGLIVVGAGARQLRLLFAADPTGAATMGMQLVDIDRQPLQAVGMNMQPADQPVVPGYDTNPRRLAPRLMPALGPPSGMWVQQEKLYFFDGKVAAVAFAAKRVLGFAPLIGVGGPYAVLETAPLGQMQAGNQATEVWVQGSTSQISLVGDMAGVRRGVAATSFPENLVNVVLWSFEVNTIPSLRTGAVGCFFTSCGAIGTPPQASDTIPGSFPEVASARLPSNMDRDLAETFQITLANPDKPTQATTALIGGAIRITSVADAGADAGTLQDHKINPPLFAIAAAEGPASAGLGETLGPSTVAITSNDHIMVAWVERIGLMSYALKTRRFTIRNCN